MKNWIFAVAVGALGASSVQATATYDLSYSATGISVSATLMVDDSDPGHMVVTGISGTRNGQAIIGLLAPGTFAFNDNEFRSTDPYVDVAGTAFSTAGGSYNFYNIAGTYTAPDGSKYIYPSAYYECYSTSCAFFYYSGQATDSTKLDSFSIFRVAAAVPEPATWAMLVGGFGVIGAAMRRRSPALVRFT